MNLFATARFEQIGPSGFLFGGSVDPQKAPHCWRQGRWLLRGRLETTGKHVAQQPQKERWQLKEMATRLWGFVWMVPAGAGVCFQRMMCGSVCTHTCTQARVCVGVCACTCVPVRVRACRCVYVREIISACVRRAEVLLPVVLRCLAAWRCIVLRRVALCACVYASRIFILCGRSP